MIDYKRIGKRIAFYRKSASLTQSVLSEKLGVTESYISQIERGSAKPSLSRLSQISDILNIDVALLISNCAVVSPSCVDPEIAKILSQWSADQLALLTDLLLCADQYLKAHK